MYAGTGTGSAAVTPGVGDEVRPYRIHVPTKHLDLTRQKLELTRLPHEGAANSLGLKSTDWWEPKPLVEPLVDFWLEKYSWREQEEALNKSLPQFRTSLPLPGSDDGGQLRLHFVHVKSPHSHAIPLLLIPPFPFTSVSFGHLVQPLTNPDNSHEEQPFHLVIPSLPGLAFSDHLPNNIAPIPTTAGLFNSLMSRLGYQHYLSSSCGAGNLSPAEIDFKLVNHLAIHHQESCVGNHMINPPLKAPKIQEAPWEWTKWAVANFFRTGILGYDDDDFVALERAQQNSWTTTKGTVRGLKDGLNGFGVLREPNTLAYALCDSPVGMLVFVLKALALLSATGLGGGGFEQEKIITLTSLAWLYYPEAALRFWSHCATHDEEHTKVEAATKPKVAITVFNGGKDTSTPTGAAVAGGGNGGNGNGGEGSNGVEMAAIEGLVGNEKTGKGERYVCPAWGNTRYTVVHTQRATGRAGLLAFERPEIILSGVRGLAKEVLTRDSRLRPAAPAGGGVAPLEQIVVVPQPTPSGAATASTAAAAAKQTPAPTSISAQGPPKPTPIPTSPIAAQKAPEQTPPPDQKVPPSGTATANVPAVAAGVVPAKLGTVQEEGEDHAVEIEHAEGGGNSNKPKGLDKGKGKELDLTTPPTIRDPFAEGESPDTLVVNTPPLDKTPSPRPSP
ncbi:Alpha/Beta hydrolase protein [Diplogelasinospora grovesii]|uniref:Alpha/Beta hydrolase protein n=1 Tax=Diplogelasinospora grovesii TaxID=303347 RepID=A0AAN6S926_9PEZI|nr:Alpha/Beta hydrolase protein [Diplogelasinospora grovesii]